MFSYESKFFQVINQIVDCIVLSLFWLIASLPVFTIGASTTALYYTVHKVFTKEEGTVGKAFWGAFKREFKQATGMWVILLVIYGIMFLNFILFHSYAEEYPWLIVMFWILMFFTAIIMMWSKYWFAYLARFDDPTRVILKNTVYMALFDFKRTLILFAVTILEILGYVVCPLLIIILPAASMIYVNHTVEKVFCKYSQE